MMATLRQWRDREGARPREPNARNEATPAATGALLPALYVQVLLNPLLVLLEDGIILAQRIALPAVGQQDAPQIGMTREAHSKHVVSLALQPVGRRPDGRHAIDLFLLAE